MTDPEAGIVCTPCGADCQVSLSGRITIDSSPELLTLLLTRLQAPKCRTLIVDFYDVVYVDTSGLAIMLQTLKAALQRGKVFRVIRLRGRPRFLFEKTRLLHVFEETEHVEHPSTEASS